MLKKVVIFTVILCLLVTSGLMGCSPKKNAKSDEIVTLKWVFLGPGEQRDSEEVWTKFNEELAKYLPNTKVEFQCIPSGEYEEKWKLMSASQENFDIAWHGWMIPYSSEVKKG